MTDKCRNKKMVYLENPSAIKTMPDNILMEAYQFAKQKNLKKDFILLLQAELKERGIFD